MIQKLGITALVVVGVLGFAAVSGLILQPVAEAGGCGGCSAGKKTLQNLTASTSVKSCGKCSFAKGTSQCGQACAAAKKVTAAGVDFLSAKSLTAKIQSGQPPILIDVLPSSSYTASRLKGAINIPYTEIAELAPKVLPDKSAEIVVYCGSYKCGASLKAATALKKLGYTNVGDYKGGLREWTALGLPREGSSVASVSKAL